MSPGQNGRGLELSVEGVGGVQSSAEPRERGGEGQRACGLARSWAAHCGQAGPSAKREEGKGLLGFGHWPRPKSGLCPSPFFNFFSVFIFSKGLSKIVLSSFNFQNTQHKVNHGQHECTITFTKLMMNF